MEVSMCFQQHDVGDAGLADGVAGLEEAVGGYLCVGFHGDGLFGVLLVEEGGVRLDGVEVDDAVPKVDLLIAVDGEGEGLRGIFHGGFGQAGTLNGEAAFIDEDGGDDEEHEEDENHVDHGIEGDFGCFFGVDQAHVFHAYTTIWRLGLLVVFFKRPAR